MREPINEHGASRFKVFIILVLLFLVIHVAVKLVPMYMDFERMKDEITMQATLAQALKDNEILVNLVKKAQELDLPLTAENFVLQRDEDQHRMKISTQWDVEVNFLWGTYIRKFHFAPAADESYSNR